MPPKTLEEIFEEKTKKKAKIFINDGVHTFMKIEIFNPDFVEWLKEEIAFYETIIPKEI